MAIIFDSVVPADELTFFAREVPTPSGLNLIEQFPTVTKPTHTVRWGEITRRNRTAKYRTFDGRINVSDRDTATTAEVDLMPLSDSRNKGEYERLKMEFARIGGTNESALVDALYSDVTDLVENVWRRLELAWGDVLSDGVLTVSEIGEGFELDFGVPDDNKVDAATLWTAAGAKPLTDLQAWNDAYIAQNGVAAGAVRMSQSLIRVLTRNAEVIAAVEGTQTGRTSVTINDLNSYLASDGLPTIVAPYDTQVDVDGVLTRTIAENKVLLTPESLSDLGQTTFGLTATALELVANRELDEFGSEEAPGIAAVVDKIGPPYREFTFVDAAALPILSDARRLFIATVAA